MGLAARGDRLAGVVERLKRLFSPESRGAPVAPIERPADKPEQE